jgi:hypothetical protein
MNIRSDQLRPRRRIVIERIRPRLTYANVIATLALFLALTGSATAGAKYLTASELINAGDLAGSTDGPR